MVTYRIEIPEINEISLVTDQICRKFRELNANIQSATARTSVRQNGLLSTVESAEEKINQLVQELTKRGVNQSPQLPITSHANNFSHYSFRDGNNLSTPQQPFSSTGGYSSTFTTTSSSGSVGVSASNLPASAGVVAKQQQQPPLGVNPNSTIKAIVKDNPLRSLEEHLRIE